ncbi:MAG: NAD(P)-binding domain-containing protein [Actinomycetota bacterium]|nr:NAD(P)-binding domain-containing protein [Actinomycetota bacterium]
MPGSSVDIRTTKVGFIGAGQMGRPMVDRLVAAGWHTEVHARRAEARDSLSAAAIAATDSATALAARSDLLIMCLFSDAQVREVLLQGGVLAAMRSGSLLVNHVTGSPALALELQATAPEGVRVLDVPVSGTAESIKAGQLTLLAAGDPADIARARGPLSSYGSPILEVGGLGDGQRVKLINNLLFTAHLRIALAAAELGESMGVPAAELARVVQECSGDSFAIRRLQLAPPVALEQGAKPYLAKDVAVIRTVAAEMGVSLGMLGELAGWADGG